jgi:hypothetical protein
MRIHFAHIPIRATDGRTYSAAIFDAKSTTDTTAAHMALAYELAEAARQALDLRIEAVAVVFNKNGRNQTVGDRLVVDYLNKAPFPRWTHYIDV